MYDFDSDDVYEPGERRRMRKYKVSVPVQPRNANGTFAPCRSEADSQKEVSVNSDSKSKPDGLVRIISQSPVRSSRGNIFSVGKMTPAGSSVIQQKSVIIGKESKTHSQPMVKISDRSSIQYGEKAISSKKYAIIVGAAKQQAQDQLNSVKKISQH